MTTDLQSVTLEPMSREELERHCKAMTDDRDGFYRLAERRRTEIERLRTAIDQVHNARLTWAMVCECTCKPCDEFYELVRDTLPDCSPADVTREVGK